MHYFLDTIKGTLYEFDRVIHNKKDFFNNPRYEHFFNLHTALKAKAEWEANH